MLIEPALADFAGRYDAGEPQVVWTRLVADLETPVSALLKLSAGRSDCFLLEAVEGGAVRGRYSIIGIEPDMIFRAFGAKAEINNDPKAARQQFVDEIGTDEPGCAGDKTFHDASTDRPTDMPSS